MICPKTEEESNQALSHLISPGLTMKTNNVGNNVGVDGNHHHWQTEFSPMNFPVQLHK